ncbi:hypothetical protein, partial [Nitrolancea hollandica]
SFWKMIRLFLIVCLIAIVACAYGIFVGEFTREEFTISIALLFYAVMFFVIACIININGSI